MPFCDSIKQICGFLVKECKAEQEVILPMGVGRGGSWSRFWIFILGSDKVESGLYCLHDQNKSSFFERPAFFQPIRAFLVLFKLL